jgi:hypothetical protein
MDTTQPDTDMDHRGRAGWARPCPHTTGAPPRRIRCRRAAILATLTRLLARWRRIGLLGARPAKAPCPGSLLAL